MEEEDREALAAAEKSEIPASVSQGLPQCHSGRLRMAMCCYTHVTVSFPNGGDACIPVYTMFASLKPFGKTEVNEIILHESSLTFDSAIPWL